MCTVTRRLLLDLILGFLRRVPWVNAHSKQSYSKYNWAFTYRDILSFEIKSCIQIFYDKKLYTSHDTIM